MLRWQYVDIFSSTEMPLHLYLFHGGTSAGTEVLSLFVPGTVEGLIDHMLDLLESKHGKVPPYALPTSSPVLASCIVLRSPYIIVSTHLFDCTKVLLCHLRY